MPVPVLSESKIASSAMESAHRVVKHEERFRNRVTGPGRPACPWARWTNTPQATAIEPPQPGGLLDGLSDDALYDLDRIRQTMWYPAGSTLFMEGQPPRGLFIVCHGQVKELSNSRDGKSIILRVAEAGEPMALSDLLRRSTHSSSAETLIRSQISFISGPEFLGFLSRHPEVFTGLAELLSRELHDAWDQIRLLTLAQRTEARLAQWLLARAERSGQPTADGVVIRIYMTREEIGDSLGMSRETVSRLFSDFKRRRFIGPTQGADLLVRPEALREVSLD